MNTRRYITIDLEWCNFRDYTIEKPETRKEIVDHFYSIGKDEWFETLKKHYTLSFIADTWNVSFAIPLWNWKYKDLFSKALYNINL